MVSPSSFDPYDPDDQVRNLKGFAKLWYHCKEQPLVPVGILLTCAALTKSAIAVRQGKQREANRYFTARVVMQGLTLAALVGGSYYMQKNTKSVAELQAEKAARRKQLWLEELDRQGAGYQRAKKSSLPKEE
ncbi:hypoxia induced protein conserved region-domain-containing protein [Lipomyces arxii]|uniref:hypoxia induced protein conserved region-domain-containing protein n=1 Tax=Lipomyces arxii TaxID=56418 RepID=UPI0034CFF7CB